MQNDAEKKEKMPYEKPALRVIQLGAEEILGVSCHTGVSNSTPFGLPDCDGPVIQCLA